MTFEKSDTNPDNDAVLDAEPREKMHVSLLIDSEDSAEPLSSDSSGAPQARLMTGFAAANAFARRHKLAVLGQSQARNEVLLEGTVEDLSKAFGVKLEQHIQRGMRFKSHAGAARPQQKITEFFRGVIGLDQRPLPGPKRHQMIRPPKAKYSPQELAQYYKFPKLDGTGQRIALIELGGGYYQSDMDEYFAELGLPQPRVTCHSVEGQTNDPLDRETLTAFMADAEAGKTAEELMAAYGEETYWKYLFTHEVTMDIQLIGAFLPGCHIDVYFAPLNAKGLHDAIYAAAGEDLLDTHQPKAKLPTAISISWGWSEAEVQTQFPTDMLHAVDQALKVAYQKNIAVCCATGDFGSANSPEAETANVMFPASSPWVLACGGTTLAPKPTADRETVWNSEYLGLNVATGGGMSGYFRRPSYQVQTPTPSSSGTWLADDNPSFDGRWLPDVAAHASPDMGVSIRLGGRPFGGFGTSAVAPMWAALIALLSKALGRRVGPMHELLYQMPELTNDVVRGDNRVNETAHFYSAGEGWDACTGVGTPNGEQMLNALREHPSTQTDAAVSRTP